MRFSISRGRCSSQEGVLPSCICPKANERLLTGEDIHAESYAILSNRNCHSWLHMELCFTLLCGKLSGLGKETEHVGNIFEREF